MEQHAVPQDITGFKFKLVGDMTLKQFGELAFGAIVAYLFFASSLHPFIKWPFVVFFILLGVGLAFLPIQERPLDMWIVNFFKAIYKPTYFTWKKGAQTTTVEKPPEVRNGFVPLSVDSSVTPLMAAQNVQPVARPKTENIVSPPLPVETVPAEQITKPDLSEILTVKPQLDPVLPAPEPIIPPASPVIAPVPLATAPTPQPASSGTVSIDQLLSQRQNTAQTQPTPAMTIEDLMQQRDRIATVSTEKSSADLSLKEAKLNELSEKNKEMMRKVDELRNQIYNIDNSGGDASKLQPELQKLVDEKATVFGELGKAREEMTLQRVAPLSTAAYKEPVKDMSYINKPKAPPPGPTTFALTSQPNVVNGLVLDSLGKPLEGVILTVKDLQGNSIRALRTSRGGQFIANTPLSNGEYYLELEKAGKVFDVWKVVLTGTVITPLEIRAKEEDGHS